MSVISSVKIETENSLKDVSSVTVRRVFQEGADDVYGLFLEGAFVTSKKVYRIDFYHNKLHFDRAPVSAIRPRDIADRNGLKFSHLKAAIRGLASLGENTYSFRAAINLIAVPPEAVVDVYIVAGDSFEKTKIASIQVSRKPLEANHRLPWSPLLLTSMGRSGTTWFMHLLREHPEIYVHEEYPHELLMMQYWTNMLVSLTTPLEADRLYDKWEMRDMKGQTVSPHVYYRRGVLNPETFRYLGSDYVCRMADFCLQSIEQAYKTIIDYSHAHGQTQTSWERVRFVSEKGLLYKDLYKEICPGTKHVFLIRDIRDNIVSSKAFNRKTGRKGFGEATARNDREFVENRCAIFNQRFAEYEACRGEAHFVRYEDMIADPKGMLKRVLEYLGLDNSEAVVSEMVRRASQDNEEMRQHKTTEKTAATAGRWKRDLAPDLQELCLELSAPALKAWGYEV